MIINLKNKLLNTGIVIDNEYLDKYVNIIISNLNLPKIKFKTQNHHIIPRYYYKYNNIDIDNSKDNIINLLYKDHILAHIYLGLCSSTDEFKRRNYFAVQHVLGNKNYTIDDFYEFERLAIENLDIYQNLYEASREWWSENCNWKNHGPISEEQKIKESKANSNLVYVNNGERAIKIKPTNLKLYLDSGWKRGNIFKPKNKVRIKNIKNANHLRCGKSYVNNGYISIEVAKDEAKKLMNEGWKTGILSYSDMIKNIKEDEWNIINSEIVGYYGINLDFYSLPTKININNNGECIKIKKSKLYWYLLNGWHIGKLPKELNNEINDSWKSE